MVQPGLTSHTSSSVYGNVKQCTTILHMELIVAILLLLKVNHFTLFEIRCGADVIGPVMGVGKILLLSRPPRA